MAMIQITFTPESAEEAAIIGEAMARIMKISAQQLDITPAKPEEPVADAPKQTRKAAPAAETATGPSAPAVQESAPTATPEPEVPNAAAEPSTPEAPAAQTASSNEPAVSLEEVRAVLAALSQAGKQQQVVALIASMGAKKLTEIPADKYAKLLAEAKEL